MGGFGSYTAATADADRDGKGQAAAIAEFTKLFLDPKGSALQDVLVDETAKLGDAVARSALRSALVESPRPRLPRRHCARRPSTAWRTSQGCWSSSFRRPRRTSECSRMREGWATPWDRSSSMAKRRW